VKPLFNPIDLSLWKKRLRHCCLLFNPLLMAFVALRKFLW
jgi:hypothetical protein